jgi:H+/Cl- antiporter ClcA
MAEKQIAVIPVWFFVGVILLMYGVIIFITGVVEFSHPPERVHLSQLHAPVWWGAFLTLFGGAFVWLFKPKKPKAISQPQISKVPEAVEEPEEVPA